MFGQEQKYQQFYVWAERGGIVQLRFARNEQDAADTGRGMAEWAGNKDAVKVKVAA